MGFYFFFSWTADLRKGVFSTLREYPMRIYPTKRIIWRTVVVLHFYVVFVSLAPPTQTCSGFILIDFLCFMGRAGLGGREGGREYFLLHYGFFFFRLESACGLCTWLRFFFRDFEGCCGG